MATRSKTTQHKIERRTYLNGEFKGKYQGTYYYDGSARGKEEFYDLKVKEALVTITHPDGFRHWQTGEPVPFRDKRTTLLDLPAILDCKLEKEDGSSQYAKLNIKDVKVISYAVSNQLYEGDFIYGDIEGLISGYLVHYDIEERVTFYEENEEVLVPQPLLNEKKEETKESIPPTNPKGCWSILIDAIVVIFYAILALLFIWLFVVMIMSLANKPSPDVKKSSNVTAQKDKQYSPPSIAQGRKQGSSLENKPPASSIPAPSGVQEGGLIPRDTSKSIVVPVDIGTSSSLRKTIQQTSPPVDTVAPEPLDTLEAGTMAINRSVILNDENLGVVDSFWIEIKWKDIRNNTFYMNYLIDVETLTNTTDYRNQINFSQSSISYKDWLIIQPLQKLDATNGTTFFANFKKMCTETNLTSYQKRRTLVAFIQSIHLLELRSGSCPIEIETLPKSSDPFGLDRTCVDSIHLEFFTPLETTMNLVANPVSKAILCAEIARYLDLPALMLYNASTRQYAMAFQLDSFDEQGRHEIWSLSNFSGPQIMYSRQEVELEGWTFINI